MTWTIKPERQCNTAETVQSSRSPLRTLTFFYENHSNRSRPALLDMGPGCSSNLEFFGKKGCKVFVEDFLNDYLAPEQSLSTITNMLNYPPATFQGILCWDIFDFMTPEDSRILIQKLFDLLRGGGMIMALFDSQNKQTSKHLMRHKIFDENEVAHEPIQEVRSFSNHYENRDILKLFSHFEIVKSYYHKNKLREYLFQKLASTIS